MSASLVGSEMCIRDSFRAVPPASYVQLQNTCFGRKFMATLIPNYSREQLRTWPRGPSGKNLNLSLIHI
eukprot:5906093-Alexandrium_andersonii.AAC.1